MGSTTAYHYTSPIFFADSTGWILAILLGLRINTFVAISAWRGNGPLSGAGSTLLALLFIPFSTILLMFFLPGLLSRGKRGRAIALTASCLAWTVLAPAALMASIHYAHQGMRAHMAATLNDVMARDQGSQGYLSHAYFSGNLDRYHLLDTF